MKYFLLLCISLSNSVWVLEVLGHHFLRLVVTSFTIFLYYGFIIIQKEPPFIPNGGNEFQGTYLISLICMYHMLEDPCIDVFFHGVMGNLLGSC